MKQTKMLKPLSILLCFVMVLSMLLVTSAFAFGEIGAAVTGETYTAQQDAEAAVLTYRVSTEYGTAKNAAGEGIYEAAPGTEVTIEPYLYHDPSKEFHLYQ